MRIAAAVAGTALLALSFCVGYAYSERRLGATLVEMQRSCHLSVAETALRALDSIEGDRTDQIKRGLVAVAKSSVDGPTLSLHSVRFTLPKFGSDDATALLRESNDARDTSLRKRLEQTR